MPDTVYDFSATANNGETVSLADYRDKVLLIVNTASQCGFTPQYAGLEKLYEDLQDKGFAVLGFPCNQFGGQEPGSDTDIKSFCETSFGTTFPLFSKVAVNGKSAHPLFKFLKAEAPGIAGTKAIKWNFTKFLIDRNGNVVKRFGSKDAPDSIRGEIEALL